MIDFLHREKKMYIFCDQWAHTDGEWSLIKNDVGHKESMLAVEEGRTKRSDESATHCSQVEKGRKLNEEIEVVLPRKGHGLLKKEKKCWSK